MIRDQEFRVALKMISLETPKKFPLTKYICSTVAEHMEKVKYMKHI